MSICEADKRGNSVAATFVMEPTGVLFIVRIGRPRKPLLNGSKRITNLAALSEKIQFHGDNFPASIIA